MDQKIKVGNVTFEIPEGTTLAANGVATDTPLKAEKSDIPEPLEQPQYIFRPNDPFGASIDEMKAITSISASHKPWVKKTWFILFVIGPLVCAELFALAGAMSTRNMAPWQAFIITNMLVLPLWLVYYIVWCKQVKR
jgi:hypothetical protein